MRLNENPRRLVWRLTVAVLCILGLGCAYAVDVTLNTTGLLFLHVTIDAPFVGEAGIALAIAFVVQATIIGSEFVIANAGSVRRGLLAPAFAAVVLILAGGFTAILHGIQLNNLTEGTALVQGPTDDVTTLTTRVNAAFGRYASYYRGEVDDLKQLSTASKTGDDPSQLLGCGPICRQERVKLWQIKNQFSELSAPPGNAAALGLVNPYAAFKALVDGARERSALFKQLCGFLGQTCIDPLDTVLSDMVYHRVETIFDSGETPERAALVLRSVEGKVAALSSGRIDAFTVLILALVAILPIAELALVIFLRIALAPPPIEEILTDLRRQNIAQTARLRQKARNYAAKSAERLMTENVEL